MLTVRLDALSFCDPELVSDTHYIYRIAAVDDQGNRTEAAFLTVNSEWLMVACFVARITKPYGDTMKGSIVTRTTLAIGLSLTGLYAEARVTDFSIEWVTPAFNGEVFGEAGSYQRLDAVATFAVDPESPRAASIVGIEAAPLNPAGEVEFSTEVVILRPADKDKSSTTLLYEVPNRGRNLSFMMLNLSGSSLYPTTSDDAGDGFVMSQGMTMVWSGWQPDLPDENLLNLSLPTLPDIVGNSREEYIFNEPGDISMGTLSYPAADMDPAKATLTVREKEADERQTPTGLSFRYISANQIEIKRPASMDAGAIYEFIYPATGAVPTGLSFIATSDLNSFLRGNPGHDVESPLSGIEHTIGMGISQSGRFLRDFIYQGFNADEQGARVFDGAMPHIAGSRKTFTNYMFAQQGRYSRQHEDHDYPGDQFPFTYAESKDPLSGKTESILSVCNTTDTCPKVIQSDTSTEFWQARASLLTTSPAGEPLDMPDDVRLFFIAGAPHFNGWNAQAGDTETCQFPSNPMSAAPVMRALLVAMDNWISDGVEPPASRYPSLANDTLVKLEELKLPSIAGKTPAPIYNPLQLMDYASLPPQAGEFYPVFLPVTDADGIAQGGVATAYAQAPLGTYYGWNLLKEGYSEGELCSLTGSYIPFPATATDTDSRKPLSERYATADDYLAAVKSAADDLVSSGLMRAEDVGFVMERAQANAEKL